MDDNVLPLGRFSGSGKNRRRDSHPAVGPRARTVGLNRKPSSLEIEVKHLDGFSHLGWKLEGRDDAPNDLMKCKTLSRLCNVDENLAEGAVIGADLELPNPNDVGAVE